MKLLPALIDKTDDAILQQFKTNDFLLEHDTKLPVTKMPKDNAPNTRVKITNSLGRSLQESVKLYIFN